jgi:hypothetical protein
MACDGIGNRVLFNDLAYGYMGGKEKDKKHTLHNDSFKRIMAQ